MGSCFIQNFFFLLPELFQTRRQASRYRPSRQETATFMVTRKDLTRAVRSTLRRHIFQQFNEELNRRWPPPLDRIAHMLIECISKSSLSEEVKGSMGSELCLGNNYQDGSQFSEFFIIDSLSPTPTFTSTSSN